MKIIKNIAHKKLYFKVVKFKHKFYFFLTKKGKVLYCFGKVSIRTESYGKTFIYCILKLNKLQKLHKVKGINITNNIRDIGIQLDMKKVFNVYQVLLKK